MAQPEPGAAQVFVGRTREVDQVRAVVDAARSGRMGALLVSGDAGVGKTRLVEQACVAASRGAERSAADDLLVLSGVCLPMSATTVPLMPLRTAVRRLPDGIRRPVLATPAGVGDAVPVVVDEWLDELCARRPVVLIVDDVQWADEGTLDVLMYLLAGPADRRLALLVTLRLGEVGPGHRLHRWLADVRRMPSLTELSLAPFDRAATRDQLRGLLGREPWESLVTEVASRTSGNAYLNRLLVEGLPGDARHLPEDLPDDLRGAVLRPWHRLSLPARELALAAAVGGEVLRGPSLDRVADIAGASPAHLPRLLREAVDAGVLDVVPGGGWWFHHPLQAEALESSLATEERRRLHGFFARAGEGDLDPSAPPDVDSLAATAAVAEHHLRAEHLAAAYDWTLRAADLAQLVGDGPAAVRHLRRLLELRPAAPGAHESRRELLDRLRSEAELLGDHETEYLAAAELLEEIRPETDPLLVAELTIRLEHLRFSTGRGFLRVERARDAVEVSSPEPGSWQHAYALAELAHASLWAGVPDAPDVAERALDRAEACGHPRALAYALAAASMVASFQSRPGGAALGARAVAAATDARDWWACVHGTLWEANGTETWGTPQWAGVVAARRAELEVLGAPHPYLAWLAGDEAGSHLGYGNWRACTESLRTALGSDPGPGADVTARLTAARLATYQGRQAEAEDHLARADELFAETSGFLSFEFDAVRAQVRLGADDAAGALDAAVTGMSSPGVPPTLCEWLCPLAARALADLAARHRETGTDTGEVLGRLDDLLGAFPHVIADSAFLSDRYGSQLAALDAWYAAEAARARRADDEVALWGEAAALLDGVFPWDAAYAHLRAGEAALVRGGSRSDGAAHLRRAHELARELRALPVAREVAALAASARVRLDVVAGAPDEAGPADVVGTTGDAGAGALAGLTAREREILRHVVAGRTYGEIARALYVSEKTVSSHISNLLRKTGTANRVELARLARHSVTGTP